MKEKILITGKGNIASKLALLLSDKYEVYFLSRKKTEKRQQEIVESRVNTGRLLLQKIKEYHTPIKTFISASAIGYYGTKSEKIFLENDLPGNDFLSSVCVAWEQTAQAFEANQIRSVVLRLGVVLSKDFGALPEMLKTKHFFFAPLASGKQSLAWVHEDDVCRAFAFALENKIQGTYNIVAPDTQTTNATFTKCLATLYHKQYIPLGVPAFLLQIILGKRTMLLTEGAKVSSKKIQNEGFKFLYGEVEKTLQKTLFG